MQYIKHYTVDEQLDNQSDYVAIGITPYNNYMPATFITTDVH